MLTRARVVRTSRHLRYLNSRTASMSTRHGVAIGEPWQPERPYCSQGFVRLRRARYPMISYVHYVVLAVAAIPFIYYLIALFSIRQFFAALYASAQLIIAMRHRSVF